MHEPTGHDSGHFVDGSARGWTWADVIDALVIERGSLAELARHLMDVAPASAKLSDDPATVERGLRRLRSRGSSEGNRYGRLVLRCLGTPDALSRQIRALGQYHSRASDLSVDVRREQLVRWDRPPVTESRDAIWVHLALATVAHQRGDSDELQQRLSLVRALMRHADSAARLEALLFLARVDADAERLNDALDRLNEADAALAGADLSPDDRLCYLARVIDQRAFVGHRSWRDEPQVLERSLTLYAGIPESPDTPPFAAFRRAHGQAWCLWRLGRTGEALVSVAAAASHAGDGGYVRFRAMALMLWSHMLADRPERDALVERARRMVLRIGDAALESRAGRLQR